MGKYGKRNVVSENITDYNVAVLGISGVGKTTLMVDTCHKLVGDDGYIILNMGKEDGISCIDGAIYENIETWKKFMDVTKDIIKNKNTDYPELKIVVVDTIDQLFEIAEEETVRSYNAEKMSERGFKPISSVNAAYGGYGAGLDYTIKLVLDTIWSLKRVGVAVWMCGHTKTKDIVDPLTDQTYTTISANLSQKYFNAIKTKMHVVGMAVIDRDIVTESTGRKDINKKDITKNKIVSEARKIVFRDDNYGVDSKSRFAYIVPEIPLDSDAFIKAMQDAIYEAQKKDKDEGSDTPIIKKVVEKKPDVVKEEVQSDSTESDFTEEVEIPDKIEEDNDLSDDELRAIIRKLSKRDDETKAGIKTMISKYGKLADVPSDGLKEIVAKFE